MPATFRLSDAGTQSMNALSAATNNHWRFIVHSGVMGTLVILMLVVIPFGGLVFIGRGWRRAADESLKEYDRETDAP
jgi:hypothetical protein